MEQIDTVGAFGKHAGNENFPVASWLVRAELRPHLRVFYRFARAIDDTADEGDATPEERRQRLRAFDAVLAGDSIEGPREAQELKASLDATGVPATHARELIQAFILDTTKSRYADWADLMAYCRLSAAPVGRYILDLHDEDRDCWPASDALCCALQVINHLQDCGADYRDMNRVYIPEPWLLAEDLDVTVLAQNHATSELGRVFDRLLDGTDALMAEARRLAPALADRRLAMEVGAIEALARRLVSELRRRDPLAERVKLAKPRMLAVGLAGALTAAWRRRSA